METIVLEKKKTLIIRVLLVIRSLKTLMIELKLKQE